MSGGRTNASQSLLAGALISTLSTRRLGEREEQGFRRLALSSRVCPLDWPPGSVPSIMPPGSVLVSSKTKTKGTDPGDRVAKGTDKEDGPRGQVKIVVGEQGA